MGLAFHPTVNRRKFNAIVKANSVTTMFKQKKTTGQETMEQIQQEEDLERMIDEDYLPPVNNELDMDPDDVDDDDDCDGDEDEGMDEDNRTSGSTPGQQKSQSKWIKKHPQLSPSQRKYLHTAASIFAEKNQLTVRVNLMDRLENASTGAERKRGDAELNEMESEMPLDTTQHLTEAHEAKNRVKMRKRKLSAQTTALEDADLSVPSLVDEKRSSTPIVSAQKDQHLRFKQAGDNIMIQLTKSSATVSHHAMLSVVFETSVRWEDLKHIPDEHPQRSVATFTPKENLLTAAQMKQKKRAMAIQLIAMTYPHLRKVFGQLEKKTIKHSPGKYQDYIRTPTLSVILGLVDGKQDLNETTDYMRFQSAMAPPRPKDLLRCKHGEKSLLIGDHKTCELCRGVQEAASTNLPSERGADGRFENLLPTHGLFHGIGNILEVATKTHYFNGVDQPITLHALKIMLGLKDIKDPQVKDRYHEIMHAVAAWKSFLTNYYLGGACLAAFKESMLKTMVEERVRKHASSSSINTLPETHPWHFDNPDGLSGDQLQQALFEHWIAIAETIIDDMTVFKCNLHQDTDEKTSVSNQPSVNHFFDYHSRLLYLTLYAKTYMELIKINSGDLVYLMTKSRLATCQNTKQANQTQYATEIEHLVMEVEGYCTVLQAEMIKYEIGVSKDGKSFIPVDESVEQAVKRVKTAVRRAGSNATKEVLNRIIEGLYCEGEMMTAITNALMDELTLVKRKNKNFKASLERQKKVCKVLCKSRVFDSEKNKNSIIRGWPAQYATLHPFVSMKQFVTRMESENRYLKAFTKQSLCFPTDPASICMKNCLLDVNVRNRFNKSAKDMQNIAPPPVKKTVPKPRADQPVVQQPNPKRTEGFFNEEVEEDEMSEGRQDSELD